jgi:hypothetical protein
MHHGLTSTRVDHVDTLAGRPSHEASSCVGRAQHPVVNVHELGGVARGLRDTRVGRHESSLFRVDR